MRSTKPPGIHLFECCQGSPLSLKTCQALVLVLTFFSYSSYHAARKTTSVVKGVLDPKTSNLGLLHWPRCLNIGKLHTAESNMVLYGGWAPFDSRNGTALLGDIDLAFLAIYAIGMFFVGHIGDRVDPSDHWNDRNWLVYGCFWSWILAEYTQLLLFLGHSIDRWPVSVKLGGRQW